MESLIRGIEASAHPRHVKRLLLQRLLGAVRLPDAAAVASLVRLALSLLLVRLRVCAPSLAAAAPSDTAPSMPPHSNPVRQTTRAAGSAPRCWCRCSRRSRRTRRGSRPH